MPRIRGLIFAEIVGASLLCASCVSMSIPDLALQAVEVVDQEKQSELAEWKVAHIEKPYQLLKVSFTSGINLQRYLAENSYPIGNEAWFCDSAQDRELARVSWSPVYHDKNKVESFGFGAPIQGNAPYLYYSFFQIKRPTGTRVRGWKEELDSFDFRQKAVDLCFELRGGAAPSPFGYKSNVVRIPAALIENAIKISP